MIFSFLPPKRVEQLQEFTRYLNILLEIHYHGC